MQAMRTNAAPGLSPSVSAPGKLFLAGEYAVLHGSRAAVAAVTVRARAFPDRLEPRPNLLLEASAREAVVLLKEQGIAPMPGIPSIDTSAFRIGRVKAGLGSSAAATVACVAAILARHGLDPAMLRDNILRAAVRAHLAFQHGRGSGADVAASTLGGVLAVRRTTEGEVRASPVAWPAGLPMAVIWSGAEARTTSLIASVEAWRREEPERHDALMAALGTEAAAFLDAVEASRLPDLIASVQGHHRLFRELGESSGAAIVTRALDRLADLARQCRGAAKPSGAGGGDLAVAFFPDPDALGRFLSDVEAEGFLPLQVGIDGHGVIRHRDDRIEEASTP